MLFSLKYISFSLFEMLHIIVQSFLIKIQKNLRDMQNKIV